MPVLRYIVIAMAVGGGLAGLAGMIQVSALQYRLNPGLSSGFGYMGFLISWLAGHNPRLIIPMAFLLAVLAAGGDVLQITQGLPYAIVTVMSGDDDHRALRPSSEESRDMSAVVIASILSTTLALGPAVLYATLGEIIGQRSGIVNLGIEGVMLVGAAVGFAVAVISGSSYVGVLAGAGAGLCFNLLMGVMVVTRGTNHSRAASRSTSSAAESAP